MYLPYKIPISVKGIVFEDNKVWLRYNERNEWELPGGKLDPDEQPAETVVRELREELGFDVKVLGLVHAYKYVIPGSIDESQGVLIIAYVCALLEKVGEFELSGEMGVARFQAFSLDEIADLTMPSFYRDAISRAQEIKMLC